MLCNRRGITPIISVVLLLMMTVAVAGLAWVWLQGMTTGTMDATKNMTDRQMQQMLTIIDFIEYNTECTGPNITNITLLLYNKGSAAVDMNTILFNGKNADTEKSTVNIPVGTIGEFKAVNVSKVLPEFKAYQTRNVEFTVAGTAGYIKRSKSLSGKCEALQSASIAFVSCSGVPNVNTVRVRVENNGANPITASFFEVEGKRINPGDISGGAFPFTVGGGGGFANRNIDNIQSYKPGFTGGNLVVAVGNEAANWYTVGTLNVQGCT